jgi:hypothetical protein
MTGIYLVSIIFVVISMLVSGRLRAKFAQYTQEPTRGGLTGREVAEKTGFMM